MKQWVNDQLEEWKKEKSSPGRPLEEYGKIAITCINIIANVHTYATSS